MPFLAKDITSTFKPSHCYGKAGELVTVISDSAGVILVETAKGNRFHVLRAELVEEVTEPDQDTSEPVETVRKAPSSRKASRKKATESQSDLFK